ncbi:MAG: hypothetical protein U0452_13630 [Anaerolineae bacterium]
MTLILSVLLPDAAVAAWDIATSLIVTMPIPTIGGLMAHFA